MRAFPVLVLVLSVIMGSACSYDSTVGIDGQIGDGAALDTEECYLLSKAMRSTGVVWLEHQARV